MNNNILRFIQSPGNSDILKSDYEKLFQIFKDASYKFKISEPDEYFQEFIVKNILNNSTLRNFALKSSEKEVTYYLKRMVVNFIINCHRKSEHEEATLSLNSTVDENQENADEFIDMVKDDSLEQVVVIEAKEILDMIKGQFSEDEKKLLCEMLYIEKRGSFTFLKDVTENVFYKRVERFKTKIKTFFKDLQATDEGVKYLLYYIYPSEVCEKFCLDDRGKK